MLRYVAVFIMCFVLYILFTGSLSLYDIVIGTLSSILISAIATPYLVKHSEKLKLERLAYLISYLAKFVAIEVRAHIDTVKRILALDTKTAINPAIIEVPYEVASDYGITLVANSITNTPGTVVVEIDDKEKKFYVHWLYMRTPEPSEARRYISLEFERYARKIFD